MKKQHIPFLLFAVLAGVMAVATVVEKFLGTPFIMRHVYGSVAFVLLWAVAAGAGVWLVARRRMWRWPATFLLHVALLVILLGERSRGSPASGARCICARASRP